MVDGVADEVDERIAQFVDHPLVEFGLFAGEFERHVLAELVGDVTDGPLESAEQRADGHHPCAEDAALQAVRHPRQMIDRLHEF